MDKTPSSISEQIKIIRKKRRITGYQPYSILTVPNDDITARLEKTSRSRKKFTVPKLISKPLSKTIRSILKRRSSSRGRRSSMSSQGWMHRLSKRYAKYRKDKRLVRLNSKKNRYISITPLTDKLEGVVRMPDYYSKLPDDGKPTRISFKLPAVDVTTSSESDDVVKRPPKVVREKEAKRITSVWGADEKILYEIAKTKRLSCKTKASTSWPDSFRPLSSSEFLCNTRQFSNMRNWLDDWKKRLEARTEEESKTPTKPVKTKTKKRKAGSSDESDDDYCPDGRNIQRKDLPNPYIIHGDCGTGKTSLVYCLAEILGFQVVEWATSERRNGKTLSTKLSGLIETHNFTRKSMEGANIKAMFAAISTQNKPKTTRSKQTKECSVLLLDDCDIIYARDDGFWATVKSFSEESKVPIVLTCTNYKNVKEQLERYEFDNFHTEHLNRCETRAAAKFLRATIFGWTLALLDKKYLFTLLQNNTCDLRKTINQLQFSVLSGNMEVLQKPSLSKELVDKSFFSTTSGSQDLFLESQNQSENNEWLLNAVLNSEFSLLVDLPHKPVTWRARIYEDLNFVPQFTISELPPTCVEDSSPFFAMLKEFVEVYRDPKFVECSTPQVHEAVVDARFRSVSQRKLYSWREVALDHLPCLSSFHTSYKNHSKYQRRKQHPFDVVDRTKGTMLDATGNLKISIETYSFPVKENETVGIKKENI